MTTAQCGERCEEHGEEDHVASADLEEHAEERVEDEERDRSELAVGIPKEKVERPNADPEECELGDTIVVPAEETLPEQEEGHRFQEGKREGNDVIQCRVPAPKRFHGCSSIVHGGGVLAMDKEGNCLFHLERVIMDEEPWFSCVALRDGLDVLVVDGEQDDDEQQHTFHPVHAGTGRTRGDGDAHVDEEEQTRDQLLCAVSCANEV